jgi:hypothetical protein
LVEVAAGVSIATVLMMGTPAYAQMAQVAAPLASPSPNDPVPVELRCVPQGEKFLCDVVGEGAIAPSNASAPSNATVTVVNASEDLADADRIRASNLVLAIAVLLFGGVGLHVLTHPHRPADEAEQLKAQIELLERIWHKSSSKG